MDDEADDVLIESFNNSDLLGLNDCLFGELLLLLWLIELVNVSLSYLAKERRMV